MAIRDPDKSARNRIIANIKANLRTMLPQVLRETHCRTEASLNAKIGSKHACFFDLKHDVIHSPDEFISRWMHGLEVASRNRKLPDAITWLKEQTSTSKAFQRYLYLFLKRSYLKHFDELSKQRPRVEESEIWIGQRNAEYGLLVTPRFKDGEWENDKSEIRAFQYGYWTVGHILTTGLVIPSRKSYVEFSDIDHYLTFFRDTLVRNSGSPYEYKIAECYCHFVANSSTPLDVPLLIPEFRYRGRERKHKYRLDFLVINPYTQDKVGFELSPWSTHGYLRKITQLTQKQVNKMASDNFAREMQKHRDYFRKYHVFTLIYTDEQLVNCEELFETEIVPFLNPEKPETRISFQIMERYF